MDVSKKCLIYYTCIMAHLLLTCIAYGAEDFSGDALFPEGLMIEEDFSPGVGRSIGNVLLVQGQAVIIHSDRLRGYWAEKGMPLYKGDVIITRDRGKIRFGLKDGSIMTLSPKTKMVLSESVFDKKKKSRSSFIKLGIGKARFLVIKMIHFRQTAFKIKTPTAVIGLRGSDFVVEATPTMTQVTTLSETMLEVLNSQIPEAPITLIDFQKTTVELDNPPTEAEYVTPEEVQDVTMDFIMMPGEEEPEGKDEVIGKKEEEKEEGKPEGTAPVETAGAPALPSVEEPAEEPAGAETEVPVEEAEILIPGTLLVEPEEMIVPGEEEIIEPEIEDDYIQEETIEEEIIEEQELIEESLTEEEVLEELPGFPGTPVP